MKLKDKKEVIMVSTIHRTEMCNVKGRRGTVIKAKVVQDINLNMGDAKETENNAAIPGLWPLFQHLIQVNFNNASCKKCTSYLIDEDCWYEVILGVGLHSHQEIDAEVLTIKQTYVKQLRKITRARYSDGSPMKLCGSILSGNREEDYILILNAST
ncbi:hypothetical protein J437_LFUL004338 [Ladona fulva]|uniref:Uncharacterized protein n=1 Tax=Ladona fulva TaxID=123851 RepID=A0A8K0P0J5_LADFU|nr:hypothetical protein J437_LFUL004338 [Ladona fulva]